MHFVDQYQTTQCQHYGVNSFSFVLKVIYYKKVNGKLVSRVFFVFYCKATVPCGINVITLISACFNLAKLTNCCEIQVLLNELEKKVKS